MKTIKTIAKLKTLHFESSVFCIRAINASFANKCIAVMYNSSSH